MEVCEKKREIKNGIVTNQREVYISKWEASYPITL